MIRRASVGFWSVLACMLVSEAVVVAAAVSVSVDRARYYDHGSKTRVVLDLSGPSSYRVSTHKSPDRIAVNIRGAKAATSMRNLELPSGVVDRVRVNRLSWGTQVVLDLETGAEYKDFFLARNGDLPDRIVLDVFSGPSRRAMRQPQDASQPSSGASAAGRVRDRGDLYIIAVDPGHGGTDPGTSKVEKRYNLDISRRIAARINSLDGYKAVLTRDRDVFLGLNRRAEIAASYNADVFVSIHVNWAPNRSARGVEIFFLSPKGADWTTSKVLANPERAANEFGLTGRESADLIHLLVDVNKQNVMTKSELLAESILESMNRKGLPPTRSVKQKGWAVLRTFDTPSVLVETGFVSNASDARILGSEKGRQSIAEAIANGIVSYFTAFPPPRGRHDPVVVYKVKRGDSLWGISRKYGTTVASIRRANKLGSSSLLRPGQELIISNRY